MWKIFKRKTGRTSIVHALFERCSVKVEGYQRRYADYLNRKVAGWSAFRVKVVLVVFILCYVSVTALVLINAASSSDSRIRVQPIYQPRNVISPDAKDYETEPVYMTGRIRRFRKYLDSLKADMAGKAVYDSIVAARPGLIDSLTQIEALENKK